MSVSILRGDCRAMMRALEAESVHCVVTSPPYWGLRDYGVEPTVWGGISACAHQWGDAIRIPIPAGVQGADGDRSDRTNIAAQGAKRERGCWCQRCGAWRGAFGLEPTYQMFVANAVEVFREVRRVLRPDGTLWLNIGDSYATGAGAVGQRPGGGKQGDAWIGRDDSVGRGTRARLDGGAHPYRGPMTQPNRMPQHGLKPKDLCGIPWRLAFALQDDGWYLRQDIIWAKPNPMPESVTDRCTKAHEYIFMLSKSSRYLYDAEAIAEPFADERQGNPGSYNRTSQAAKGANNDRADTGYLNNGGGWNADGTKATRNKRSVWAVSSQPFSEAHFATFPPALIEPCILAGCPEGGLVLDPFGGAGTTGLVADRLKRDAILIELNPDYAAMAERRIRGDAGMFARVQTHEAAE